MHGHKGQGICQVAIHVANSGRTLGSPHSPTPIGQGYQREGAHIVGYYVSYVQHERLGTRSVHKKHAMVAGGAKRRVGAKLDRRLRPYDGSRCAEHGAF
jgi:hypothetical protein